MSEWQPIETAPRDGRQILAWFPEGQHAPQAGDDYYDGPYFVGMVATSSYGVYEPYPDCFMAVNYEGGLPFGGPTHWMPLPEPPK